MSSTNSITPKSLKADNESPQADHYLKSWQEHLDENNIIFTLSCSDSRLVVPRNATADIRSIGAAALPEFYSSILNKKLHPQMIVVIVHHDGSTVKPGKMPHGCGGLRVKGDLEEKNNNKHKHSKVEYSTEYVKEYIIHEDPFIQGVFTGEEIAELSNRPVLVATEDHRTGELYVIATFLPKYERGLLIRSAIPLRSGFEGRYNPKKIYSTGIPHLTKDQIPEEFDIFIKRYELFISSVRKRHPNLFGEQKVINPSIVALTTEIRPIRARFPRLIGQKPNIIFTVTIQRNIKKEKGLYVEDDAISRAINQMHFAFTNALEHKGDPNLGFSRLYNNGTLIIEGDSTDQVDHIVDKVLQLPYIQDWLKLKNSRIITLNTSKGRVQQAKLLKI